MKRLKAKKSNISVIESQNHHIHNKKAGKKFPFYNYSIIELTNNLLKVSYKVEVYFESLKTDTEYFDLKKVQLNTRR